MGFAAHLLIAGAGQTERIAASLAAAGCRCDESGGASLAAEAASRRPNVVLLGDSMKDAVGLLRGLKAGADTRHIPVAMICAGGAPDRLRAYYEAGADEVFEQETDDREIRARLRALLRLSAMEAELDRRAATAAEFGVAVDTEVSGDLSRTDFRLLVVGLDAAQLAAVCPRLSETGLTFVAEPDPYRARSRVEDDGDAGFDGALVYIQEGADRDKALYFCHSVRNDRRLFDLPIFVAAEEGTFADAAEAYSLGASVFAATPLDCDFVDIHLRLLLRGRELKRALGRRIASALAAGTADPLGSVYSSRFVESHLARLAADGEVRGMRSSAILLYIPTITEILAVYGEEAATLLRQQLADWLSGLVRVEDTIGHTGTDEFLVLLPETPGDDAETVRGRITGVLHQSEFRLTDNVPVGVNVYLQSALATIAADETLESLVGRASEALE